MSFYQEKLLPVSRQKYVSHYFQSAGHVSIYLSMSGAKAFQLQDIVVILSATIASAEYLRAYMSTSTDNSVMSTLLKLWSVDANGSAQHYYPAFASSPIILHEYDRLFISMIESGAATNWQIIISGWAITQ